MLGLSDREAQKPYSIACSPERAAREGAVEFLIQTYARGRLGPHLSGIRAGSLVRLDGPFGTFGLPRRPGGRRLLFIAGGSGIAPLRSIIESALAQPDPPAITLAYSARSPDDFAFRREFVRLARTGLLRLRLTATRSWDTGWRGRRGRITQAWLKGLVAGSPAVCFVCGPPSFVDDVPAMLKTLGVAPSRIRREEY